MTKDGFTLLAMGFTGKKAIEFKLNGVFNKIVKNPKGGRSSIEYAITVTDSIIGLSAENGQLESDLSLDNPSD